MRHLHTIVCAAAVVAVCLSGQALSQEAARSDQRTTNRDFLELPQSEQRRWVNGFMVGMSNALALRDVEAGRCVARWYFEDEDTNFRQVVSGLAAYPDERPTAIIFAYARRACPELIDEGD